MCKSILAVMAAVLLAGCATQPWLAHQTATVDQVWKDQGECIGAVTKEQKRRSVAGEAKLTTAEKCKAVNVCLHSKGYAKIPSGKFNVPIEARIRCVE